MAGKPFKTRGHLFTALNAQNAAVCTQDRILSPLCGMCTESQHKRMYQELGYKNNRWCQSQACFLGPGLSDYCAKTKL